MIEDRKTLLTIEEDVNALRDLLARNGRKVREALRDSTLDWRQLTAVIPERIVWMVIGLSDSENAESLKQSMPATHRYLIEEAAQLVRDNLGSLVEHPAVKSRMKADTLPPKLRPLSPNRLLFLATPFWVDSDDKLAPLLRVSIVGSDDKDAVFATMDWDDVIELAQDALNLIVDGIERAQPIYNNGLLDLWHPDRVRKGLRSVEAKLRKIHAIAPSIGLDLSTSAAVRDTEKEIEKSPRQKGNPRKD
jgi:hypothetical protein